MANRFRVGAGGNWADTAHWSTVTGGASGASAPTTNDDVFIDGNASGTITLTVNVEIGSLSTAGFTGTLAVVNFQIGINGNGVSAATGNVTFSATTTFTGTGSLLWHSGDPGSGGILTMNGVTWPGSLTLGGAQACPVTLGDNSRIAGVVSHSSGIFNTGNLTHTWGSFTTSGTATRVLTLGSSNIVITGSGTPWVSTAVTNMTMSANTATITFTGVGISMSSSSGLNYNGTSVAFTGGGSCAMGGSSGIKNLTYTGTARGDQFGLPSNTYTGTVTFTGADAGTKRLLVKNQGNPTVPNTITASVTSLTNVDFQDITGAGAATWTGTSVGDCGGNSGITFTARLNLTNTRTTTFVFSDPTAWSGGRAPLPQDDVTISGNMAGQSITVDMIRCGRNIDFSGVTGNATVLYGGFGFVVANYGSLVFGNGVTCGSGNSPNPSGRNGTYSLTSDAAGKLGPNASMFMNAPGSIYKFTKACSFSSQIDVSNGILDGNGQAITSATINLNGSAFAVGCGITWGNGSWTLTGTGNVLDFSGVTNAVMTTGRAIIIISDTSATAKTIIGNNYSFPTVRYNPAGTGSLTITGNNNFIALLVGGSRSVIGAAGATQTISQRFTVTGAVAFSSSVGGTATTFHCTSTCIPSLSPTLTRTADVVFTLDDLGTARPTKFAVVEPAYILKALEPTYKLKAVEPPYALKSLEPTYKVKSLEPSYSLKSLEPAYKLTGVENEY